MWQWQVGVKSLKSKVKVRQKLSTSAKNVIAKINKMVEFAKKQNRKVMPVLEAGKILSLCGINTPKPRKLQI